VLIALAFLVADFAPGSTIPIDQSREDEPNDSRAQANDLNDNSGTSVCALLQALDDDYYRFTTTAAGTVITVEAAGSPAADTYIAIVDSSGSVLDFDDNSGEGKNARINNLELTTAGTYYVWVSEATGANGPEYTYSLTGQIEVPDITDFDPPFYLGAVGISTTVRATSTTVAMVWNQAIDAISPASGISYNIYYDTQEADVFANPPKEVIVGRLYTTITGLSGSETYYFAVRARDEAGNEEKNTAVIAVPPFVPGSDFIVH